jgi:DNA/RNA endonuclease YhcR with UshA esterase domain
MSLCRTAELLLAGLLSTVMSIDVAWSQQAKGISASEASNHVGDNVTVCGVVASATYATRSKGKPTFLNLDKAYPNHIFTAVIFDDYRDRFDYPPESLAGSTICVTGLVEQYKGRPQIKVKSPSQIRAE